MWKNIVDGGQVTIMWSMRTACWIPEATNTHTQTALTLIAFPQQQWLHEGISMLHYTYLACLVKFIPVFLHCLRWAYLRHESVRIFL